MSSASWLTNTGSETGRSLRSDRMTGNTPTLPAVGWATRFMAVPWSCGRPDLIPHPFEIRGEMWGTRFTAAPADCRLFASLRMTTFYFTRNHVS